MNQLPKLRDGLVKVRRVERGEPYYMYKVVESGDYFRVGEVLDQILGLLDGNRTPEEIVEEFNARNPTMAIDVEFLEQNLKELREAEIIEKPREEKRRMLLERIRDQRRRRAANKSVFGNVLDIKLSAWNPDRFFDQVLPYFRFFFTPGFVIFSASCALAMLAIWATQWERLMADTVALLTFQGMDGTDILQFFIVLFVIGFLHESAHGLTCKNFGGHVTQMGFMLIYFTPCFFVDVSDAHLLDNHAKRQWVIFAGGYLEIFICSLATFAWALTDPGTLMSDILYKTLLMTGLSSVIVNYNPFIKLDGYYSLMDYLQITDLWERSFAYTSGWIKKTIFRLPVELETTTRSVRRIFVTYTLLSVAYKFLLIFVFLVFLKNVLLRIFGETAYILLVLAVILAFRRPLRKLASFLKFTFLDKREVIMSKRSLSVMGGVAALVLVALTLLPVPVVVRGEFALEPHSTSLVRPAVEGRIEQVLVEEGQMVRAGDELAILSNESLERRLPVLEERLRLSEQEIAEASNRGAIAVLGKRLRERDLVREQIGVLREKMDELTLRSPRAGVVITPRLNDLTGSYLNVGERFCEIAGTESLVARIPIRERRMDEILQGQRVDLKFISFPFRTYRGRVTAIAPASAPVSTATVVPPAEVVHASLEGSVGPGEEVADEPIPGLEYTDFDVIVELEERPQELRNGMAGRARIRVGRSTLARRMIRSFRRWYESRIW